MLSYIIGKIINVDYKNNSVIFENNYIGYSINVGDVDDYEIGRIKKIYVYENMSVINNRVANEMYGFDSHEKKDFFMSLLKMENVGPKSAIRISNNDPALFAEILKSKNVEALKEMTKMNEVGCKKIIEANSEFAKFEKTDKEDKNTSELKKASLSLGYSATDTEYALKNTKTKKAEDLSDSISNAIKAIANKDTKKQDKGMVLEMGGLK